MRIKFLNWLFVPKCIACKKRLKPDNDFSLCPECLLKWEREKTSDCPMCGQRIEECWCGVQPDTDHNIIRERHLSYYSPNHPSVTKSLVLSNKNNLNANIVNMLSQELSAMISEFPVDESFVLVHIPRSKFAVKYYGFDQTLELAKRISSILGFEHLSPIVHQGKTVQKRLNYKDRIDNVKKSYYLCENAKSMIKGKRVVLIDDVVTTGASAAYCAKLLKRAGAKGIYFASIAKSYR